MNSGGGGAPNTTWITLAIVLLVVVRFLFRELRQRKIRVRTLWIRPGILGAVTLLLIGLAFTIPGVNLAALAVAVVIGIALGIVTGTLVVRSTTFAPADERGTVLATGSIVTVIVWVVAIALRLVARFAFAGTGAGAAEQFELNAGLVALVTAAFVVVALAFHRAIDRLAPEAAARPL
ncbi:MAG: hypothetical protein QOD51_2994 [Candidatus Eremiobacteraeota bacterium]|nr:hypothetical protein [Candidatus Eremiobacteraeota bacterium]